MIKNEKGFTLIEIIMVLVILGILASVAVPKYIDLQSDARNKAAQGAIAALQSAATMSYAQQLLNGEANASSWNAARANGNVADYYGTISGAGPVITVRVTGPTELVNGITNDNKSFSMW